MTRVLRIDAGELAAPERLANGWLRVEGRIARVGPQTYDDAGGGSHVELRLPEDVFDAESLASFHLVPVTNNHPPVLLDSTNASTYSRGSVGESVRKLDDTWVGALLMITDGPTIQAVESGRQQLSNGYTCELDTTQDPKLIERWGPYAAIQRKIRGNHLAVVDAARAGTDARIRLDSTGNAVPSKLVLPHDAGQENTMATLRIDGLELGLNDANAGAIQAAIDKALGAIKERSDSAVRDAISARDSAVKTVRIVKDNAGKLVAKLNRIRTKWDAQKAKMVTCDECLGSGKVDDDATPGKQVACDFCDGAGEIRMHSPISTATKEGAGQTDDDDLDDDLDDDDDEEMDADELEVEQSTETESGKADSKRRKDAARRRRADERREFADKLQASLKRRLDRAVRARVAMETEARKFLGADADLTKLDAIGIQKAVVLKLNPQAKLDGKSAEQIAARYDAEIESRGSAASDAARRPAFAPPPAKKNDGSGLRGRELMEWRTLNPGAK